MNNAPRILIIRLSALGDILHTLPAFTNLRTTFPDAKIDWLVAKQSRFLLSAVRGINEIHTLDTRALLRVSPDWAAWRQLGKLRENLRFRSYDVAIDFQGLLKTAFLCLLSGSKKRIGFSKNLAREFPAHWFYHQTLEKPQNPVHVLELNRMLAALTGAQTVSTSCDFVVSEDDTQYVNSLIKQKQLRNFIVLNPGGGWPTKRWRPENYGALAKRIHGELGFSVVVTTGPGEEGLYQTLAEHSGAATLHHFAIPFLQLIPLLKQARLLVAGDTGPFHLACALGIPVVGIFGPTSPVRNGPWSEGEEVVLHRLPCSDCYKRSCPTHNECMAITEEEVFAAVVRRLGTREDKPIEHP
jgi:heptosyltransferase-1